MAETTLSADLFLCLSKHDLLRGVSQHAFATLGWEAKETLFVLLLERLGRPTLAQYTTERRAFQKRPAEARMAQRRWSEETFRNIFLKILLKDLKELGFVRMLSVDDLLGKRRACLQAMAHLVGIIDPSFAPPALVADKVAAGPAGSAAGQPDEAPSDRAPGSGKKVGVAAGGGRARAGTDGKAAGARGSGRGEEVAAKGRALGRGVGETAVGRGGAGQGRQRPSSAAASIKSPHRDAAVAAAVTSPHRDGPGAYFGAGGGRGGEGAKGSSPRQPARKPRVPQCMGTPESRPAWVSELAEGKEPANAHDWEDLNAADGAGERDGWMLASVASPKRPKQVSSTKDKARIVELEEKLAQVERERDTALADLEDMRWMYKAAMGDSRGVENLTLGRIRMLLSQNWMLVRQTSELSRGLAERGAVAERVEAVLLSLAEKLQRAGADQDSRVLASVHAAVQSVQNELRRVPFEIAHTNETGNRSGAGLIALCKAYADVVDTRALLKLEGAVNDIRGEVLAACRELHSALHTDVRDRLLGLRDVLDAATDTFLDGAILVPNIKERKSIRKSTTGNQGGGGAAVQVSVGKLVSLLPPALRKKQDVAEILKTLERQQARLVEDAGTSLRGEEPPELSANDAWEQNLRGGGGIRGGGDFL